MRTAIVGGGEGFFGGLADGGGHRGRHLEGFHLPFVTGHFAPRLLAGFLGSPTLDFLHLPEFIAVRFEIFESVGNGVIPLDLLVFGESGTTDPDDPLSHDARGFTGF